MYDDADLQSIGYAFRKASSSNRDVETNFSPEFSELINKETRSINNDEGEYYGISGTIRFTWEL